MSAAQEVADWVRLAQTPGVGPDTARRLLAAFGLPEQVFKAARAALSEVVSARVAQALLAPIPDATQALIARTLEWLAQPGNHLLTLADTAYPQRLLEIADPPIMLYAKGRIDLLGAPSVAIVGSRNATAQGVENAAAFAAALARAGWTIVSGLALGIDTAAHRGGLAAAGSANPAMNASPGTGTGSHADASRSVAAVPAGSTVAVIGTGADVVYPARNRTLAHEIAEAGCIVSEYPLGMPAIAANFPRRNRIISGLSHGILVIEAAAQSGSLITARMAAEQGRDVFAIPGSIHSPLAKGCHQLIRQGAKLVDSAADVLGELQAGGSRWPASPASPGSARPASHVSSPASSRVSLPLRAPGQAPGQAHVQPSLLRDDKPRDRLPPLSDADADPVLRAMGFDPVSHDALAQRCGLGSAELATQLLGLELQGNVEMLPGGAYQRIR